MLTPPPPAETIEGSAPASPSAPRGVVVRQLPFEEWDRLIGLPALPDGFIPDPLKTIAVIAELKGKIIGFWMASCEFIHCEGFWVDPAHQKKSRLPLRIFSEMREILDRNRIPLAFCWVDSPDVADYLVRLEMTECPVRTFRFEPAHVPEVLVRREFATADRAATGIAR